MHAPFCARRCPYCDFAVTVRSDGDPSDWLAALAAELAAVEEEGLFTLVDPLDTLYVGGGTPSMLGAEAMAGLSGIFGDSRLGGPQLEWTAEANPESLTLDVARGWVDAGVNRLSLGVQSFDEAALRWMGRLHGADGASRAVAAARTAGLDNVSVDLIFGLPSSLGRSWDDDLARVLELDVVHVSLYGLTVEAATPLGRAVEEGREPPVDEDRYRDEYLRAVDVLTDAGYEHYEVSNFARAGAEARHNAVYWRGEPYLGIGNSAHSYAPPLRRWNVRDWETYRRRALTGGGAEEEREVVGTAAAALERVWLGLRTAEGIEAPLPGSEEEALVETWLRRGLAARAEGKVRLTAEGWLMLDRLAVELDTVAGELPNGPRRGEPAGAG